MGGLHHVLLKPEVGAEVAVAEAELFAVTMARFVGRFNCRIEHDLAQI
jgi:hypothetical protein